MQSSVAQVDYLLHTARAQGSINAPAFQHWLSEGAAWATFHRLDSSYLIRFPALADFEVSSDARRVQAYPSVDVSKSTLFQLYQNLVLPLALSQQGALVLHGSTVEIGELAVAFLGRSGQGKSTLAASFATNGSRFLSDDGLVLHRTETTGYVVQPSHPSIRLWDDSREALVPAKMLAMPPVAYTPKSRLLAGEEMVFCPEPRRLARVYVLAEGDDIAVQPLGGRDAVIEMMRSCFLLGVDDKSSVERHHTQLLQLAGAVPFFRLSYPRRFDGLAAVRHTVRFHAI